MTLAQLAARARAVLVRLQAERLDAARRPTAIEVRWAPRRIATLDVGGTLGALQGADLDRDGVPELYAVTDQAVLVYAISSAPTASSKVRELARLAFVGDEATVRPRDAVSTLSLDEATGEVMAGSSSYARSVRARWQGGALVALEALDGLPLCMHRRGTLVPGRNYFADRGGVATTSALEAVAAWRPGKDAFFGERCRQGLILADGKTASAEVRLPVDGPLQVTVQAECGRPCAPQRYELTSSGVAFDIGDVDRDGRMDVAYSGAGAPGDRDAVRVVPVADPRRTLFRRAFTGGVAALAMVDLDSDGATEVVVAVRLPGSPRVDLWRLN